MAINTRSLTAGLFAGLVLAVVLQQLFLALAAPQVPAPLTHAAADADLLHPGSTSYPLPAPFAIDDMAQLLRNSLQIARRQAVRWGPGGYKSSPLAAALSPTGHPHSTSTSTSTPASSTSTSPRFSTTAAAMTSLSQKSFAQAIKERRTIYALNKQPTIDDKKIVEIVKDTVLHVPSSFNSQSSRLVVLLNAEHDKFWDFVLEILKPMVPEDQFASTEQRISGFKGGYGTVLFFEDPEPVQALQKAFALYAHHFPTWSEHTSAMHQFALWVALEAEGLGANLQHYNPIIDRKAQEHWNIPMDWKLTAQLVFGGVVAPAGEKEFKPVEGERMFVHGAKV